MIFNAVPFKKIVAGLHFIKYEIAGKY